ncbi:MAG: VWA domain-containing protein [Pyrinomonadaceae bacterium]|nr:VWA domain-containing protein [Pyrinomonadaceae bacterium]
MKKIVVAILFVSCVFGSASAQSGRSRQIVITPGATPSKPSTTLETPRSTGSSTSAGSGSSTRSPSTIQDSRPPVLQRQSSTNQVPNAKTPQTVVDDDKAEIVNDDEVLRVETAAVTIPVSVLDRNGHFIPNLKQRDFQIFEDNKEQEVSYFGTTEQPFTVVLLIDVSSSTEFKIDEIQDAVITFVGQLKTNDKVMIVSFDEKVRVLSEPTNDRNQLTRAIRKARFGGGTSLYDAVDYALNKRLNKIEGRKAIVLFTDGVDTTSYKSGYSESLRDAEESSASVYPVYYDTSGDMGAQSRGGGGGTMGNPNGGLGQILGGIFGGVNRGGNGGIYGGGAPNREDYYRGESYLEDLAKATGGTKYDATSTRNLDTAFFNIAEELRRQYTIGFYPQEVGKVGQRKQLRVRVNRPNLIVQARDSYIVGEKENKPVSKLN